MIQPASFFSSIAPVKTFNEAASLGVARPNLKAGSSAIERIEQPAPRRLAEHDNRDPQSPELSTHALDFIDTILTDGQFLPLTDAEQQPFEEQAGSHSGNDNNHSLSDPPTRRSTDISAVRAAAEAWQQAAPNRLDSTGFPPGITTYLTVQTGGTPALGLSLFA